MTQNKVVQPFNKKCIIVCDNCHKEMQLLQINLCQLDVEFESGDKVKLTQFKCPFCSTIFPVQLDNETTDGTLQEVKSLTMKYQMLATKKTTVHQKQWEKLQQLQARLKKQRQLLVLKYNNQVYQYEGAKIKLEFKSPTAYVGGEHNDEN